MDPQYGPLDDLLHRLDDTLRKLESLGTRLRVTSKQNLADSTALRDQLAAAQAELALYRRGYPGLHREKKGGQS